MGSAWSKTHLDLPDLLHVLGRELLLVLLQPGLGLWRCLRRLDVAELSALVLDSRLARLGTARCSGPPPSRSPTRSARIFARQPAAGVLDLVLKLRRGT